jgi:hypothetical protein
VLPEIVVLEREFQMREQAYKILPHIAKLERLLGTPMAIPRDLLDKRVAEAIDKQTQALNLEIRQLDTAAVKWADVVIAAARRLAPFQIGETEKGFRDAVVLETLMQLVAEVPPSAKDRRVVLLTGDGLLRGAAELRCVERSNVQVFGTIEELKGLIRWRGQTSAVLRVDYRAAAQGKVPRAVCGDAGRRGAA